MLALLLVQAALLGAAPAWAQDDGPPEVAAERSDEAPPDAPPDAEAPADEPDRFARAPEPGEPLEGGAERPLPDYDGRPPPPPTAGQRLLWIPRILFAPLYFVAEFLIRRPLGWLVSNAEEHQVPAKVQDFFTFGRERNVLIVPTVLLDFGLRPSVGAYLRWDDALFDDNAIRMHAGFWGPDWLSLTVADRVQPDGESFAVQLRGELTRRPDHVFYGIGGDTQDEQKSRYASDLADVRLTFSDEVLDYGGVEVWAGLTAERFRNDTCCSGAPIEERVARGELDALPPGYEDGYLVWRHGARLQLDSRRSDATDGDGLRLEGEAEVVVDLEAPAARQWVRYGGALTGFMDVSGRNNVIALSVGASFADAVRGEVPFTDLVSISGDGPMSGFVDTRLLGASAIAARLEYRWPVYAFLDGTAHLAAGNVFDRHLSGFELDRLRLSFGLGLAAVSGEARDHVFSLLVAFGTDELDQGASVESFRFVVGGSRAF